MQFYLYSITVARTRSANLGCLWCVAGNRYCEWRMTRTFHSCWWATWSTWKSSVRSRMRKPWSGPRSGASPTWKPLPKPASMWTRLVVSVVWRGQNLLEGWVLLTALCSSSHSMCRTWRVFDVYCTLLILVWDCERLLIHAVHFLWCGSCCMGELTLILNWVSASHFRHFSFNQGFLTPRTRCLIHLPLDEHSKLSFFPNMTVMRMWYLHILCELWMLLIHFVKHYKFLWERVFCKCKLLYYCYYIIQVLINSV